MQRVTRPVRVLHVITGLGTDGAETVLRRVVLDHRVVEVAWRIPLNFKVWNGQGKWLLRTLFTRYVPTSPTNRPRQGFGIPLAAWLRTDLREWAEALVEPRRLDAEGYFNTAEVCRRWTEHLSGERNWHYHLWDVLMFQAWLEVNT